MPVRLRPCTPCAMVEATYSASVTRGGMASDSASACSRRGVAPEELEYGRRRLICVFRSADIAAEPVDNAANRHSFRPRGEVQGHSVPQHGGCKRGHIFDGR